ncbi:hypothetical protein ACFLWZ_04365 [Chloroflexota bacterium]
MAKRLPIMVTMLLALLILIPYPVFAEPPEVNLFSGSVTLDGEDCPGSIVEVRIGDAVVGTATVTPESMYYLPIPQMNGVPLNGTTISFYVDDIFATTDIWYAGGNIILDLSGVKVLVNNPSVEIGLASIQNELISVMSYMINEGTDGWTVYNPSWPAESNTLTTFYRQRGYWINVIEACVLIYGPNYYNLTEGWNLIGWVGLR